MATVKLPLTIAFPFTLSDVNAPTLVIFGCAAVVSVPPRFVILPVVALTVTAVSVFMLFMLPV